MPVAHEMIRTDTHRALSNRGPQPRRLAISRRRAAFTLLEVILALVILSAALAIIFEVMQLANQNAADDRIEKQHQFLATSVMDEILARSIDE